MFCAWKLACLFWWCCNYALVTKKLHNFSLRTLEKLPLDWEFPWLHHHHWSTHLRFGKDLCKNFHRSETHWHLIFKLFHSHFIKDFFTVLSYRQLDIFFSGSFSCPIINCITLKKTKCNNSQKLQFFSDNFFWWTGNKSTDGEKMTVNFQIVKKMSEKNFSTSWSHGMKKMTILFYNCGD